MMRPGRKKVAMVKEVPAAKLGSPQGPSAEATAVPFPTNVEPQAKKISRKRGERRPPRQAFCSGRIRQGPTFKFLARPREEVRMDVENATKKSTESVLVRS